MRARWAPSSRRTGSPSSGLRRRENGAAMLACAGTSLSFLSCAGRGFGGLAGRSPHPGHCAHSLLSPPCKPTRPVLFPSPRPWGRTPGSDRSHHTRPEMSEQVRDRAGTRAQAFTPGSPIQAALVVLILHSAPPPCSGPWQRFSSIPFNVVTPKYKHLK